MNPAPVNIRTSYAYDDVGNVVNIINGRGIRTSYFVNELNQVVQTTRAASVPAPGSGSPPEPISLTAFGYRERISYDFNNNVTRRQVEDRGNTSNTGGFVDSTFKYDILNRQIEITQEVDVTQSLVTRYRYDANENRVMTIRPAGNADSAVYDERDLLFNSIRGAATRPAAGLYAATDPTNFNRPGGAGTLPSTTTYNYDRNKNLVESVDAEDNGGTKSSIAGGLGDVTRYTYDGYDRRKIIMDSLGNRTSHAYDPASHLVRVRQDGDPVDDKAGAGANKTLSATEYIHDELSRVVAMHGVLFQTPDVTPARPPTLTDTPAMDALAPYLADASSDTAGVPGATGITVIGRVTTITEYDRESRVTFTVQDDLDNYRTDYDGASRIIRTLDSALNNGFSAGVFNPAILSGNTGESAYDDNNEPASASDDVFCTYTYDSLSRKIEETEKIGLLSAKVVSCDYDIANGGAIGQMTSCTYPDGRKVDSFYDSLDRLVRRRDNGQATDIGKYEYIGPGRVAVLTYQNGTRLTHIGQAVGQNADLGFDNLRRIVDHRWESFTSGVTPLGNGNLIVGFGHQDGSGAPAYDRMSRRSQGIS